jgi:hypothetical protein
MGVLTHGSLDDNAIAKRQQSRLRERTVACDLSDGGDGVNPSRVLGEAKRGK